MTLKPNEAAAEDSPTEVENDIVGQQNRTYLRNQPVPMFDYSAPRDVVIQLLQAIVPKMPNTWTVFFVPGVGAVDVTPSKGYPIPFGIQLTNPVYMKTERKGSDGITSSTLDQPEPDGLYRSGETDATWVLAVNEDGFVIPEYHEEMVACYPFPVSIDANGRIVRDSKVASVTVDLSRAGS